MCDAKEILFISADYRLLYPGTGFDEVEDVKALFQFLSTDVNSYLPEDFHINPSRIAVAGGSAGGYISRLASLHAKPRPVAMLNFFGMGGDFLTDYILSLKTPETISKFHWTTPSDADILALGEPKPLAKDPYYYDGVTNSVTTQSGRHILFSWHRLHGTLLDCLVGEEGFSVRLREMPYSEREAAIPAHVKELFPQANIDENFPPTFLAHGDEDYIVFVEESEHNYQQLQAVGVRSELHVVPGADHGLVLGDGKLAPGAEKVQRLGFEFLFSELSR
ncbi:hypothetical protein HWV62_30531 [Athelia sp. TMB]|nr:hypothetical protein HWV62_30531 [Athelia sp. TMB]